VYFGGAANAGALIATAIAALTSRIPELQASSEARDAPAGAAEPRPPAPGRPPAIRGNLDGLGGAGSLGLSKDVAGSWAAYPAALLLRHELLPNSPAAGLTSRSLGSSRGVAGSGDKEPGGRYALRRPSFKCRRVDIRLEPKKLG
jgi:hypothetical protein